MRMSLFCALSRMDHPQEIVDETAKSVNPLDQFVVVLLMTSWCIVKMHRNMHTILG